MEPMESLRRGLSVLECFSTSRPELRLVEICHETGLAASSAHRVVTALVSAGYLQKFETSKTYAIGPRAYTVGALYLSHADPLIEATCPVLDLLSQLTRERVALHVLDHTHTVMIASRECAYPVRYTEPAAHRALAHASATGKAMLSCLDGPTLEALFPNEQLERFTAATITTRAALLSQLDEIRRAGVAFNDGENFGDMRGIAAPVRDATGAGVAGISVAGPWFRMEGEARVRFGLLVRKAGLLASRRLGYAPTGREVETIEDIRQWWEDGNSEAHTTVAPVAK